MSFQARHALVNHANTLFQRQSQRDDLLDVNMTQTELIALLLGLANKGHIILFTAVHADHHNDCALGLHSHSNGYAADVWFQKTRSITDYLDAESPEFLRALADAAKSPWLYQIGIAGSANTLSDHEAAGPTAFADGGADHIHLGAGNE